MNHTGPIPRHVRICVAFLVARIHEHSAKDEVTFLFCGDHAGTGVGHHSVHWLQFAPNSKTEAALRYFESSRVRNPAWQAAALNRWFTLADWIIASGWSGPIVHLDSDILTFCSPRELIRDVTDDFAFGLDRNPGVCYFRDPRIVVDLAERMLFAVSDPSETQRIRNRLGNLVTSFGGDVQEMGIISDYCQNQRDAGMRVGNATALDKLGFHDYSVVFDQPVAGGLLVDDFGKVVLFRKGFAYCLNAATGAEYRALTLHVHGQAKRYMHRFLPGNFEDILSAFSAW